MKPPYCILVLAVLIFSGCSPKPTNIANPEPTAQLSAPVIQPTATSCPRMDIEHIATGHTAQATLITHKDWQTEIRTRVSDGDVLVLKESDANGHQWMVYYLLTCQFGFIDKNQVVIDEE